MGSVLLDYDLTSGELISFLLEYEAHKLGLEISRLTPKVAIFRDDKTETTMLRACVLSYAAYRITHDKSLTKLIFDSAQIANCRYAKFLHSQFDEALEFAKECDFDVVIKPTHAEQGLGVFTSIYDEASFCACWKQLERILKRRRYKTLLVEKRFVGTDFRFFVVGRQVVGVLERRPANVTADGERTISQLVAAKNNERRQNPDLRDVLIKFDDVVLANLRARGLTVDSVLEAGKNIALRTNANISTGGESIDRTDEIPPRVRDLAVRAVTAVPDLHTCGVDIMAKDIYNDTALGSDNIVFIELNGNPGMTPHHFPRYGRPRNVARAILLMQFPHLIGRLPPEDYRHDFDEYEELSRQIARGIVACRGTVTGKLCRGKISGRERPRRHSRPDPAVVKANEIAEGSSTPSSSRRETIRQLIRRTWSRGFQRGR